MWCGGEIPDTESARTFATPPGRIFVANNEIIPLPAGSAWVICGGDCPELPEEAEVFYRTIGWETNPRSNKGKPRKKGKTL